MGWSGTKAELDSQASVGLYWLQFTVPLYATAKLDEMLRQSLSRALSLEDYDMGSTTLRVIFQLRAKA